MRSSTTRKRPSVSAIAATVTSGLLPMREIVAAGGGKSESSAVRDGGRDSAAAGGAQAVLGRAGVPDLVELLQVDTRNRRIVDVGHAVPGVGAHAIDDRAVIGDEIAGGALRTLRGDVAD